MDASRKKIVITDDNRTNLTIAKNALIDKYDVFTVPSGAKLLELLERVTPDLILLDIEMPEMNGYEVIKTLKSTERTSDIPVIFLSGIVSAESELMGLNMGAVDYIFKPFSRNLLLKRIELHLLLEAQKQELKRYSGSLEGMVIEKTKTVFELQNAILKTVAELVERRDSVTGGHIERTQIYLGLLVSFLLDEDIYTRELSSWDIDLFIMSSQLHDVGKISIKDEILLKPGELSTEEFEEMKKHTSFGMEITERIESSTTENAFIAHAKIMAASHHERWDGTGYPLGLMGKEIPLQGRLMAIVDVYDALTNDRPYKKAFPHKKAIGIIRNGLGTHFDPLIGEVFIKHEKAFGEAKESAGGYSFTPGQFTQTNAIFQSVTDIVDIRGGMANGHSERMRRYLRLFVDILSKDGDYAEEIASWDKEIFLMSAQLHDVGKIAVSDSVLNKEGKLTADEYSDVKRHADFGVEVIQQIMKDVDDRSLLHHAEVLAGTHHEKWDGAGYPNGLKGKEIPLQGRIMALVDVYDALTNNRPHRGMMNHREAVSIVRNLSGTQFDPGLVRIFLEHEAEFEKVGVV